MEDNKKDNFDNLMDALDDLIFHLRKDEKRALDGLKIGKQCYVVFTALNEDKTVNHMCFHKSTDDIAYFDELSMKVSICHKEGTRVFRSEHMAIGNAEDKYIIKAIIAAIDNCGKVIIGGTKNCKKGEKSGIIGACDYTVAESLSDAIRFIDANLLKKDDVFVAPINMDIYDKIIAEKHKEKEERIAAKKRKVHMTGDIIITDPCYFVKHPDKSGMPKWNDYHPVDNKNKYPDYNPETGESKQFDANNEKLLEADRKWRAENPDDWDDFERAMKRAGITNYLYDRTMVGDGSWDIINSNTGEKIGEFCVDSGEMGVFQLADVKRYNPAYDTAKHPHSVAVIRNFDGYVHLKLSDSKSGETNAVGEGNINFFTKMIDYEEDEE